MRFVALAAFAGATIAAAQPIPGGPLETPPTGPYTPGDGLVAPFTTRDISRGVQVSINAMGQDVLNDAANEPSIAVNPMNPNQIVIGWRQFDTIASNFRQAGCAYSADAGRTWTNVGPFEPGVFRSDPVLACTPAGRFLYNSLTMDFHCGVFRSESGGVSWTTPAPAFGGDKQWMCVDQSDSPGRGFAYAVWNDDASCCGNGLTRSADGGVSWQPPVLTPRNLYWGTLDTDSQGNLYIAGVEDGVGISVMKSANAKFVDQTPIFTAATAALPGLLPQRGLPINPGGLAGQVWVACDRSTGATRDNVYVLCSVDPPGSDPLDVMFARSTDGGAAWSTPLRVHVEQTAQPGRQWFGTMSVAPDGRIDVIYNEQRSTIFSSVFYVQSRDAGATWSPPRQLTQPFNSLAGFPSQNKIGDYCHMVSDRSSAMLAYAATFNQVSGIGRQDVWFLRIPADMCDSIDFNNDGVFPDSGDIADFLSVFGGGSCSNAPNCNDIDFNNDGVLPDSADIEAYLRVFAGGSC